MMNDNSASRVCLVKEMRVLWTQHIYWTRLFIVSTLNNLDDVDCVTKRLMRNPKDFEKIFNKYYCDKIGEKFCQLLTEHLSIGGELVNEAKKNNGEKKKDLRKQWDENACNIAKFLSCINPFWCENKWKRMLCSHLNMTENEVKYILTCKCKEDLLNFDMIEKEALQMADYMSCGIVRQCSNR